MKLKALYALAVYLVHLGSSAVYGSENVILEDPISPYDELPVELNSYILDYSTLPDKLAAYVAVLEMIDLASCNFLSEKVEKNLMAHALEICERFEGPEKAKLIKAIGIMAVKLCTNKLLVDLRNEKDEDNLNRVMIFASHPNLRQLKPEYVFELIDEMKNRQLNDFDLSDIMLPFVRGNFTTWYNSWTEEDKAKYRTIVLNALAKAGKLDVYKELEGEGKEPDQKVIQLALTYRCQENNWERLHQFLQKYPIPAEDCMRTCIEYDSDEPLGHLMDDKLRGKQNISAYSLVSELLLSASKNRLKCFRLLAEKMDSDSAALIRMNNQFELYTAILSSRNSEILDIALKNQLIKPELLFFYKIDPIEESIKKSSFEMFKCFVSFAVLNMETFKRRFTTYLYVAIKETRNKSFIEFLLQKDPNDSSKYRFPVPLDPLYWSEHYLNGPFPSVETLDYLLDENGCSPLPKMKGHYSELVKTLISAGGRSYRVICAQNEDGSLKHAYLQDVLDFDLYDLAMENQSSKAVPYFMKRKPNGDPLFPKMDILKHMDYIEDLFNRNDGAPIIASFLSKEVMGDKCLKEADLLEYLRVLLGKLEYFNEIIDFWTQTSLTSLFTEITFTNEINKMISTLLTTDESIFQHFTQFNNEKPLYPSLRLPEDFLFQHTPLTLGLVDHVDRNGKLYFGLSMVWKFYDLRPHFLEQLASLYSPEDRGLVQKTLRRLLTHDYMKFLYKEINWKVLSDVVLKVGKFPEYQKLLEDEIERVREEMGLISY